MKNTCTIYGLCHFLLLNFYSTIIFCVFVKWLMDPFCRQADLLLSYGYEDDIKSLTAHVPRRCQCLLMSATSRCVWWCLFLFSSRDFVPSFMFFHPLHALMHTGNLHCYLFGWIGLTNLTIDSFLDGVDIFVVFSLWDWRIWPTTLSCFLISCSADVEKLKKLILHNPFILTLPEVGDTKDEIIPKNVQQFWVRSSIPYS